MFPIIVIVKMDDGCTSEASAWAVIKEIDVLGIWKGVIEIKMVMKRVAKTKDY